MSTASVETGAEPPSPDDIDTPEIRVLRACLKEGRGLTLQEQTDVRAAMERAGRGTVVHGILHTLGGVVDKRALDAVLAQNAKNLAEGLERHRQYELARPDRWRALPPLKRALITVADEGRLPEQIARALIRVSELWDAPETTLRVPETFEREGGWR